MYTLIFKPEKNYQYMHSKNANSRIQKASQNNL